VPQCIWASGSIFTIGDQGYFIHRKSQKPALQDIENDGFTKAVRKFMKGRKTDDYLEGWIYCDPLLRFLRTIGLINAASLRSICLQGQAMHHTSKGPLICEPECRNGCLRYYLRLYGPFIQRYCPGIKKLTLQLHWTQDLKKMQRELIIILRSEMASFPSLRELVVTDSNRSAVADGAELMKEVRN
jgi:hypothetical protein